MSAIEQNSVIKWRTRFLTVTALLLLIIVGMGIGLVRMGMITKPLRVEVEALRAETGRLTIENPDRVHVIGIETAERDYWRWRIYVPFHHRLFLHTQTAEIPKVGLPLQAIERSQIQIPYGEHVLEFRIKRPEPVRNLLVGYLRGRSSNGYLWQDIMIENHKTDWINSQSKARVEDGGRTAWVGQEVIMPGDSFVLLRLRAGKVEVTKHDATGKPSAWNYQAAEEPTDGVMLWIDHHDYETHEADAPSQ